MHLRRDSDDDRAGGDIFDDQGVGTDLTVVANRDVANDFGSGADEDTIANRGMTLELSASAATEGHLVVHEDVVTDDLSLIHI